MKELKIIGIGMIVTLGIICIGWSIIDYHYTKEDNTAVIETSSTTTISPVSVEPTAYPIRKILTGKEADRQFKIDDEYTLHANEYGEIYYISSSETGDIINVNKLLYEQFTNEEISIKELLKLAKKEGKQ